MNLRRATVMVPNLFTVGNMALGFFAILAAMDYRWVAAPTAIFLAQVCDILDGRMARWLGHTSQFGGQFDSFADWISFGIAPALMIYILVLKDYERLGIVLTFFYIFAGAFRLARFNVKSTTGDDSGGTKFSGLPIPGAGGFLAVLVFLFGIYENGQQGRTMNLIYNQIPFLREGIVVIVFGLALLMISKVEYSTFKKTKFFRPQSTHTFLITLFVAFMIYARPQNTLFVIYTSYILWGLVTTAWRAYRIRGRSQQTPNPAP